MASFPFDGSSRIVVITAGSASESLVGGQRAELLKHVPGMDERDMVVFVVGPENVIEPVHGGAPAPSDVEDFMRRDPASRRGDEGRFAVLLVGKDGGVKFRSEGLVLARDLFALIDTMPMRRQETKR
jgi:hypothetical protein